MQMPVIQKMDASLQTLKKCKQLRLSTNSIDKISNLHGLDSLEILSMGRNQVDAVSERCETVSLT